MSVVTDVICDGCGERVGDQLPNNCVTVVGIFNGEVTSRHYGQTICACASQLATFLDDLKERRGAIPASDSSVTE